MSKKKIYIYCILVVILGLGWLLTRSDNKNDIHIERTKIALREVGNQLLLSQNDSTSLILPIEAKTQAVYTLTFQEPLFFEPNALVSIIEETFLKSTLPKNYLVEVVQCIDNEVAYSYEISDNEENTIIPCAGRYLTKQCYSIDVRFTRRLNSRHYGWVYLYFMLGVVLMFFFDYVLSKRKQLSIPNERSNKTYNTIGSFKFFPDQNKLIKAAVEIELSKKECELLAIFASRPNEIIKRDELTKKVWEDNGVFVGRSLDTYISKLRKKLMGDDTVKLTNIHGVGYKLEILR